MKRWIKINGVLEEKPVYVKSNGQLIPIHDPISTPSSPTIGDIDGGDEEASLHFSAPSDDGGSAITDYEYQIDSGSWISAGGTDTEIHIDSGLSNDTEHDFRVRAINENGAGDPSPVFTSRISILFDNFFNSVHDNKTLADPDDVRDALEDATTFSNNEGLPLIFSGTTYEYTNKADLIGGTGWWIGQLDGNLKPLTKIKTVGSVGVRTTGILFSTSLILRGIEFDFNTLPQYGIECRNDWSDFKISFCDIHGAMQREEHNTTNQSYRAIGLRFSGRVTANVLSTDVHNIVSNQDYDPNVHNSMRPKTSAYGISNSGTGSAPLNITIDGGSVYQVRSNPNESNWGRGDTDCDGVYINGATGGGAQNVYIKNVDFTDCEKRFIKGNSPGELRVHVDDCEFHVQTGKPTRTPVDYQENTKGHMKNCHFLFDRGQDGPAAGVVVANINTTIANGTTDFLHESNVIEVADNADLTDGSNLVTLFQAGRQGRTENIRWRFNEYKSNGDAARFIWLFKDAESSKADAENNAGYHGLQVEGNFISGSGSMDTALIQCSNRDRDCDNCITYGYYEIDLIGGTWSESDVGTGSWCPSCGDFEDQYVVEVTEIL